MTPQQREKIAADVKRAKEVLSHTGLVQMRDYWRTMKANPSECEEAETDEYVLASGNVIESLAAHVEQLLADNERLEDAITPLRVKMEELEQERDAALSTAPTTGEP